ncbi:MAG: hypothetical protein AB7O96_10935 [Pseudobdellovibrionaceae bacterium]
MKTKMSLVCATALAIFATTVAEAKKPTNFSLTISGILKHKNTKERQKNGGIEGDLTSPTAKVAFHNNVANRAKYNEQAVAQIDSLAREVKADVKSDLIKNAIEANSEGSRVLVEALIISGDGVVAAKNSTKATAEDGAQVESMTKLQKEAIELLANSENLTRKDSAAYKALQRQMEVTAEALLGNAKKNEQGEVVLEMWENAEMDGLTAANAKLNAALNSKQNTDQAVLEAIGDKLEALKSCSRG